MAWRSVVLITGANGYIGSAFCRAMAAAGKTVRGLVRSSSDAFTWPKGIEIVSVQDLALEKDWSAALKGVDCVIHAAGLAHAMKKNLLADFYRANVETTGSLALASAKAGVRRFIFISSISVYGEADSRRPFREEDPVSPRIPYAVSKWEAEQILHRVSRETEMETVILRSPMVYGPNAPGHFSRLTRLVRTGLPLPFAHIKNLRSFIYLSNLVDAIATCVTHPSAAGQTFLLSDGQDISTPDFITMIASAMNKKASLFFVPADMLKIFCRITGKTRDFEKLTGSFLVDIRKIRAWLDWKPPFSLESGIKEAVNSGTSI